MISGVGGALFQFGELGQNLGCRKQCCLSLSRSHPSCHRAPHVGPSLKPCFTTGRSLQLISSQSKCLTVLQTVSSVLCSSCYYRSLSFSCISWLPALSEATGVGGAVTKEPLGTLCPFWRDSSSSSRAWGAAAECRGACPECPSGDASKPLHR